MLDQVLIETKYGWLTSGTRCLCVISQQYWNGVTCMAVLNIQAHELDLQELLKCTKKCVMNLPV
jgi:hypothetical protein